MQGLSVKSEVLLPGRYLPLSGCMILGKPFFSPSRLNKALTLEVLNRKRDRDTSYPGNRIFVKLGIVSQSDSHVHENLPSGKMLRSVGIS